MFIFLNLNQNPIEIFFNNKQIRRHQQKQTNNNQINRK